MARKPTVMALDTPVTDQPVSWAMGRKRTGSETSIRSRRIREGRRRRRSPTDNEHRSFQLFLWSAHCQRLGKEYQLVGIQSRRSAKEA
jgi:hypothetical protein